MKELLNLDNPVFRALSKIFDVGWLSLLYVIFCIPVVTIGPATIALYYTAAKVIRKDAGYVRKEFWQCFKSNFKNGLIFGVAALAIQALMIWNVDMISTHPQMYSTFLHAFYMAVTLITLCMMCYIYPILSRFEMKRTQVLRLALYMLMRHFVTTIILAVIVVASLLGLYYGVFSGLFVVILVIPGAMATLYTVPMERILRMYTPKSDEKKTSDGEVIKEWYE